MPCSALLVFGKEVMSQHQMSRLDCSSETNYKIQDLDWKSPYKKEEAEPPAEKGGRLMTDHTLFKNNMKVESRATYFIKHNAK